MQTSCGIYLYNMNEDKILIGHVTNTEHAFSIPKGLFDETDIDYFSAATRELFEETNVDLKTIEIVHQSELDFVVYKAKPKRLKSFLVCIKDIDEIELKCNSTFINKEGLEQPEIDWFKWVTLLEAEEFLPLSQVALLNNIREIIHNINIVKS